MTKISRLISSIALCFFCSQTFAIGTLTIQLTRVATTFRADPEAFQSFLPPTYQQGIYAFIGTGHGATDLGIFSNIDGMMKVLTTNQKPIPNGSGYFQNFGGLFPAQKDHLLSLNPSAVVFLGHGDASQAGIYRYTGQHVAMIANQKTPYIGGNGAFSRFGYPTLLKDNSIGFFGEGSGTQAGIFLADPKGMIKSLVNTRTAIPHGQGRFTRLSAISFAKDSTANYVTFAFIGQGQKKQLGLYRYHYGQLKIIANENTPLPAGNTGYFTHFTAVSFDNRTQGIAFLGGGILNQDGVFYFDGKTLLQLAGTQSFIPGGHGQFTGFSELDANGGLIAFHGIGLQNQQGIYLYFPTGSVYKLLNNQDKVDGKAIQNILISNESLSDNHIALLILFQDGSQAIYVATFSVAVN